MLVSCWCSEPHGSGCATAGTPLPCKHISKFLWASSSNSQLYPLEIPSVVNTLSFLRLSECIPPCLNSDMTLSRSLSSRSYSFPPTPSGLGGAGVFVPQYNFQTLLAPLVYTDCLEPSPLRLWECSLPLVSSWLSRFSASFRVSFPHHPFTCGIPWFGPWPYSFSPDALSLKFLIQFHSVSKSLHHSVTTDSLQPHGLSPARLLCPWDFPGKNTGVGCYFLLQGIFPTRESNPYLLHCTQILLPSKPPGKTNPIVSVTIYLLMSLRFLPLVQNSSGLQTYILLLLLPSISHRFLSHPVFMASPRASTSYVWHCAIIQTRGAHSWGTFLLFSSPSPIPEPKPNLPWSSVKWTFQTSLKICRFLFSRTSPCSSVSYCHLLTI